MPVFDSEKEEEEIIFFFISAAYELLSFYNY